MAAKSGEAKVSRRFSATSGGKLASSSSGKVTVPASLPEGNIPVMAPATPSATGWTITFQESNELASQSARVTPATVCPALGKAVTSFSHKSARSAAARNRS